MLSRPKYSGKYTRIDRGLMQDWLGGTSLSTKYNTRMNAWLRVVKETKLEQVCEEKMAEMNTEVASLRRIIYTTLIVRKTIFQKSDFERQF